MEGAQGSERPGKLLFNAEQVANLLYRCSDGATRIKNVEFLLAMEGAQGSEKAGKLLYGPEDVASLLYTAPADITTLIEDTSTLSVLEGYTHGIINKFLSGLAQANRSKVTQSVEALDAIQRTGGGGEVEQVLDAEQTCGILKKCPGDRAELMVAAAKKLIAKGDETRFFTGEDITTLLSEQTHVEELTVGASLLFDVKNSTGNFALTASQIARVLKRQGKDVLNTATCVAQLARYTHGPIGMEQQEPFPPKMLPKIFAIDSRKNMQIHAKAILEAVLKLLPFATPSTIWKLLKKQADLGKIVNLHKESPVIYSFTAPTD